MKNGSSRNFILTTLEYYYDTSDLKLNIRSEETLSNFINDSQTLLIQSSLDNEELSLHTQVQGINGKSMIFYKNPAQHMGNEDDLVGSDINIMTLSNSPAQSLYHTLRQVYSPLLTAENDVYSMKLQKNLSDLESILRTLTHGKSESNINIILSVDDELEYWKTIIQKKEVSKKEKEAAATFCDLFQDVCEEIKVLQSNNASDMREAAENIGGLLDDVWRFTSVPYPQSRMIHVFDIIGHVICSTVQRTASSVEIWKVDNETTDYEILTLLSEGLKVVQTWTSACKSLTETYWPNYALHAWNGKAYVPIYAQKFENRLKEIHDIRSTHSQLNKLLSKSEKAELQTEKLFAPFHSINVWMCNGANASWDTAVSKFASSLRPAEAKIADKLKPRLHNTSTKQMLYEFMRYRALIDRPLVKHALNNELEIFVSSLLSMLTNIQSQLDSDELDVKMYQPPEMSSVVHQIQWAKQTEARVKEVQTCAEKYLKEFEGSAELLKVATRLLKDLKTMYMQLHEEWSRDLQAQAKNGLLQLSSNKPVVEFSGENKMMEVMFNPRLVWAELEARSLASLGLPSPPAAAALDSIAAALTHARALQQVASFHNTLGERMIPSTRPMMLQAALDLSSLVQNQKAVYWDDMEQLANYTDKLKQAVLKLETQNTYLTSQHVAIRGIVEKLMDTELLAKQAEWKKGVKDIRDIIEQVEANGYKNSELWRSHWDWQLYKALECQYVKTLLSLHKHFPLVRVDLVLRGHCVRPQPCMEELRVQHYHQLRRLVSLPAQFVGLAHDHKQNIFAAIVDKHGWLGNKAVKQLEAALSSLDRTCVQWTRRAALACVPDLEALCTEHLKQPADWENNFKACKAYGQAVAKMTFEDEKIEWLIVGTASLRREFEAQTRSLWACLMSSLQSSCRSDAAALDAFVATAQATLQERPMPKNAKELADISAKQQALREKMPEMESTMEALKKKGHMLRTWGGDASVEGTIKEWQKIRELLHSQQQMFEHQADIVKSSLKGEWENLNTGVEAWVSRWLQARPRMEDTRDVEYSCMVDRCRSVLEAADQWAAYHKDKDELMNECQKFNMKIQISETWNQAETMMAEYLKLWTIFKEYNEEFETIAKQEWIVFQKKLHLLDEFVTKWKGNLEPYTIVTLFLQQELEKYSDLTTILKYLRGSDFTERHWREVFGLLNIEPKKPDTLQVKDLLAAAPNIKKQVKSLQKICASASSESAVRNALNELELWFAGARFTIIYYDDKSKRQTPIVKDFKEISAKIEEQQWVVSSVSGNGASGGSGTDACAAWELRLRAARRLAKAAHHAQRRWLYLEPILSNEEGDLATKFRKVDQGFRQAARLLEADSRLSALLQSTRLQPMLDSISEQLLACQTALNQYIDEKRSTFPRLYFLSDDDLLELLGQARAGAEGRAMVMQTHLKKLFPGATGVSLGPGDMSITALKSHYGETLQLEHPVDIDCSVEVWLRNLEAEMRFSLKNTTLKCVLTNSLQNQDPFSLPTQILCLAQNIRFTEQAEKAITSRELHKLKGNVEKENSYYASAELEDEGERNKRQALILQCAHYMSVIKTLIDNNVTSTGDWLWQKQLRFYLMDRKDVVAKMGLAQISYSYEYLGINTGQFVRTELADECFLILTQSLHLGMVGNPFGPAGTGKTESVKALGGLVGRLVLIFNCDEAMDSACLGRLLTGLALCGAWGCFDEFNRLAGPTLCACAVQLGSLLAATRQPSQVATATLNNKQVVVSPWCGVAVTMNPAGRGYGGRRALPAALCQVLRPVAMVTPRGDRVAHHLLHASGVPHAHELADRLYNVFTMAGALITDERHYDWGLRALKASVVSAAAALVAPSTSAEVSLESQLGKLRRLLARDNMSKLTADSAIRFENILTLVFADVTIEQPVTDPIINAIEASVDNLKLAHNKVQVQKCTELYEQLQQRMGVVIVGPPGSGKTTIRRMLKNALTNQGKNIVEYTICPKAMNRDWLLGNIDHDTRLWTDGVISATALEVSNQPSDVWSWVVCDGDIDPEWVEALNSVLDDNRLLTLPSGWRVQFSANVNFVFETHGLEHASPATVSRMGVVLLSDDVSCSLDLLSNWVQRADIEQDTARAALPILQESTEKCVRWLTAHKSDLVLKLHNVALIKQIVVQFEYLVQNLGGNTDRTTPEELVYLAIQASTVDILKESAVDALHQELSPILGPPPPPAPRLQEWVSESLLLSARMTAVEPMLRACLASDSGHLLLVGPDACAKNILAEHLIKEGNSSLITIDCTPILEPEDIIAELKRNNVVRSGAQSGGSNARVTLLVRSLHRAHVDSWGTSAVHSFLLQLIEYNGFWSRGGDSEGGSNTSWSSVTRVRVIATAHSAVLTPRLAARLAVCIVQEADEDELLELVKFWLQQNVDKNMQAKDIIVLTGTILTMFKEVTETFRSRPQYNWNASHLKSWCENVKWYSPVDMEQLDMAITAEANAIFRDRLVTEDEKSRFASITRKYFKTTNDLYFACKLRGEGVYLEPVDYGLWHQTTEKLINQCLSEYDYNTFGDSSAEICSELVVLCGAMARACNGGMCVCVGSAGVGRRAAALLTAAAVSASTLFVYHPTQFYNIFKNAVSSAASGSRTLVVVCELAARKEELAQLEALYRATSAHALPAPLRTNQLAQQDLDNIKANLGIVICLDERQDSLPELLDKFPMLYNEAHLLWLDKWSHDTLRDMPALVIQRLSKENMSAMTKEELDAIPTDGFVKIHNSLDVEPPCRYVHFIKSYYNIVVKKKSALLQRQATLSAGVDALERARSEVATLQKDAAEQEALLSEKQAKANSALDQISATVRATTDKKEEMHALKRNIELENEKLQVQKKEIEAELASVEPVIAAARAAVGDIRPESLSEVRSLRAPPDVVRDVLEGVLRLMGIADTSWHSMKNFLSKRGVKEDIRCLDASQINPAALANVQKLVAARSTSFSAAAAKRASAACAPLAAWVRANIDYAQALQRVQPLKNHQAQLHRNLQEAEDQLTALSSGLATVDERVAALKEQLGQHTRDACALELRLSGATDTIRTATELIDRLHTEYTAWVHDLENIHKEIEELNQRSLLAAAYIVYLPEATEPESRENIKKWSALIGFQDESFSVINFLSTTEKQLKWEAEGLSTDLSAVKNAVLIDQVLESPRCGFTPLVTDPDGEGLAWLHASLADTHADFVSQHSEKLLTAVQYAVRLGRILVITDVEEVHPCWLSLVRALPPARLVLVSRDEALVSRLPQHLARRLAPLHFTARLHPLSDQLINYALQQQNPDISEKAKEIKLQKAKLQKQQHELQENVLRELSRNGDILHDAALLESLNSTRAAADTVRTALAQAQEVEAAADAARSHLCSSARRAASLTLAVKHLHARWPLVSLPIHSALRAYVDAVRKAGEANGEEIVKYLTRTIIARVLLALHKKDKYIVVLHLLKQVFDDLIPDKLWQIFIGNDDVNDAIDTKELKKLHPWIPDESLKRVAKLKAADEDLYNRLSLGNSEDWKQIMSSGDVNMINKHKLSAFERVVSVAALSPDTLYRAVVAFVDSILGVGAVFGGSAINIAARGRRPVLLLASHAHDALAASAPPHALTTVESRAGPTEWRSALSATRAAGGWLALDATGAPFTHELQAFVADAATDEGENCNEEFRLWILSEYRDVPPLIANSCINVILEAPEGVKNNVLSTISAWKSERVEPTTARLLACLALFHALVQERRGYIPQGWSQWYAWEWGDVWACARAAREGGVGGSAAAALCLAMYGARVQSEPDARALSALHARALPPPHAPPTWTPQACSHLPPATHDLQVYCGAFASLPDMDSPQLLGLPANCRRAWEQNAARDILLGLRELNCTVSSSSGVTGATSSKSLASLWKKLMSGSALLKEGWDGDGNEGVGGWWGGAVRGEVCAAGRIARLLHAALRAAARDATYILHETPEQWQVWWSGPRAPQHYLREFCHRARAALARLGEHAHRDYMPQEVDLRGFLCAARPVWALRARSAERRRLAPVGLVLTAKPGDSSASADEVVLSGLRLSGAGCSETGLEPARAADPPHAPAPPLHAKFITQEACDAEAAGGWVDVPVYSSESREQLLFTARMQLARVWSRDTALLHTVALFVAPLD